MFVRTADMNGVKTAMSGQLDPALKLLSETQAALLGVRTANDGIADVVGGLALESETAAGVSQSFASSIFAKIDAYENTNAQAKRAAQAAGSALEELLALPQPLRDVAIKAAGETGWNFAGPGVKSMTLDAGGKLTTRLLRIEQGHGAPSHDHTGTEYTLVVKGAFNDRSGYFGPGDIAIKRSGEIHNPVAEAGSVCFALTVEEGEVAFTGALGVLQRLFTRH